MDLLQVRDVTKVYNKRLGGKQYSALQGVSFDVARGEFTAIMGASGAGKTTLLNIIASLDKPTTGDVILEGTNLSEISDRDLSAFRRKNLGFVFQDFNLLDTFSVRDNILLPLVLSNTPLKEMEQKLPPLAQKLGIEKLLDKLPYEVSGGEKQRTAIARAIITTPKLILADEPTGALDSKASNALLKLFNEINLEGQTILMVTHSAYAASHASRVLFIKDGVLFSQVYRGGMTRQEFYDKILSNLSVLEGGSEENA